MDARLASTWAAPAAAGARGPRLRDGVLVAFAVGTAIAETLLRTDLVWPVATAAVTIAVLPGLLWRRVAPLIVLCGMAGVAASLQLVAWAQGVHAGALGSIVVMLAVPYALFRWGTGRARVIGGAVVAVGTVLSAATGPDGVPGAIAGIAIVGGTCLVGVVRRQRVEARSRQDDLMRTREREALARDLHDTVAHHVSSIAIRAQAAGTLPSGDAQIATSLVAIEREARDALAEMRTLVRGLREADGSSAELAPLAGLAQLEALAGDETPRVTVSIEGARRDVPTLTADALHRIAQEAVTNARRHARGAAHVDVALVIGPRAAALRVRDDGAPVVHPGRGAADGYGLRGMSERATALGGRVTAGPSADGWIVEATLPLAGDHGVAAGRDGAADADPLASAERDEAPRVRESDAGTR